MARASGIATTLTSGAPNESSKDGTGLKIVSAKALALNAPRESLFWGDCGREWSPTHARGTNAAIGFWRRFLTECLSTTVANANEVQINEHTLCRATIHAFDAHDLPMIQEIRRFVHNVFDDVDAQFRRTRESTRSA
jgi:hypothetical protein